MFNKWYETDNDCCQHMRKDGRVYEMIQCLWLDTTEEDRLLGQHEYVILQDSIDLNDVTMAEIYDALATYDYELNELAWEYGHDATVDIIAECLLEERIVCDACVIDEADTFEEAKAKIMAIVTQQND